LKAIAPIDPDEPALQRSQLSEPDR